MTTRARIKLAELGICCLYPPQLRRALMDAENWPQRDRLHRIDQLTAEAARHGLARLPTDDDGWLPPSLLANNVGAP